MTQTPHSSEPGAEPGSDPRNARRGGRAHGRARGRTRARATALAVATVVVGATALTGCGSADIDDAPVERKTFPLSGKALTVESDNTPLDIVAADVDEVEVTRQVDGWVVLGSGPNKSWRMADGKLTLKVDCDGVASHCEGRHTIKVPRGVDVTVNDANGGVTASGFSTALKIDSDNGKVVVRDASGPLDLRSDNGRVDTERITSTTVKAVSDNGSVKLRLGVAPDRVETVSDNGSVDIELPSAGAPYAVTAKSDNGSVDVSVPTDDASARTVTAKSDNGKVVVRIAN
ncbi:DUF4097 family beta strand repeat-containing protein [Streptomyces sp. NPDC005805]|uniref:DUF4097 family beta strand repeat-containing protein n=1 Tax=Streptomyces sp. NPDC005805 TaxID=3157068 RepID=UPI0033EE61C4